MLTGLEHYLARAAESPAGPATGGEGPEPDNLRRLEALGYLEQ